MKKDMLLLGMNHGQADNKLRKLILHDLIKTLHRDICFRCGEKIENPNELSIDHKVPWAYSKNPKETFYDLENISFSHFKCNSISRKKAISREKESDYKRRNRNKKLKEIFGIPYSTASYRLNRLILFKLLKETKKDICYRCGKKINEVNTLSIEHKRAWKSSNNPIQYFFDLENISFSHLHCNISFAQLGKSYKKMERIGISGHRGVCIRTRKTKKYYEVTLCKNKNKIFIGGFSSLDEAIEAYEKAVKEWDRKAFDLNSEAKGYDKK